MARFGHTLNLCGSMVHLFRGHIKNNASLPTGMPTLHNSMTLPEVDKPQDEIKGGRRWGYGLGKSSFEI